MYPSPILGEINGTPIPISFEKRGDPAMIDQNVLSHIFVTANKVSNNKNI